MNVANHLADCRVGKFVLVVFLNHSGVTADGGKRGPEFM